MIKVAAAILIKNNELLIARRPYGDSLANCWEFPGGKIEAGETPEQCLAREILEELGLKIRVNEFFCKSRFDYPNKSIMLFAYYCELVSGEAQLNAHDQIDWVLVSQLENYSFAPADIPIVRKLQKHEN